MTQRFCTLILLLLTAVAGAQAPESTSPPRKRTLEELNEEGRRLTSELFRAIGPREMLLEPGARESLSLTVVPILRDIWGLADELAASGPAGKQAADRLRGQVDDLLCVFADPDAIARLTKTAEDDPGLAGIRAQRSLLFGRWIRCNKQPEEQHKVLDDVQKLADRVPANPSIAELLDEMLQAGPGDDVVRQRIARIISTKLTSQAARQLKARIEGDLKMAEMENKPLLILGQRANGEMLTTKAWRGQVVLVIFWSSELKSCREENNEWRRLYSRYHKEGLEMLGVACDRSPKQLSDFLMANPGTVWPQLFDPQNPGMHPLATEFGITDPSQLPVLFLIDRQGVLRTTKARQDTDKLVRELLQEP